MYHTKPPRIFLPIELSISNPQRYCWTATSLKVDELNAVDVEDRSKSDFRGSLVRSCFLTDLVITIVDEELLLTAVDEVWMVSDDALMQDRFVLEKCRSSLWCPLAHSSKTLISARCLGLRTIFRKDLLTRSNDASIGCKLSVSKVLRR